MYRNHGFAVGAGHGQTKRCLEDHFRSLRQTDRDSRNGRVINTWRLLRTSIMAPTMSIPERHQITSPADIESHRQMNEEAPSLKSLVGVTKQKLDDELRNSCLHAIREGLVLKAGTPASRRAVSATHALLTSAGKQFEPMQRCWIGDLVQPGIFIYNRHTKKASTSLGAYTWSSALWELRFLGAKPHHWLWLPAPQSSDNPTLQIIDLPPGHAEWAGLPREPTPVSDCPVDEGLQEHGLVLAGRTKDLKPLINHRLANADLPEIVIGTWKTVLGHIGGQLARDENGKARSRNKEAYVMAVLKRNGYSDDDLTAAMDKMTKTNNQDDNDIDDEWQEVVENFDDNSKRDFDQLWKRVTKRKQQQTAAAEIKRHLAQQQGEPETSATTPTPNMLPPPVSGATPAPPRSGAPSPAAAEVPSVTPATPTLEAEPDDKASSVVSESGRKRVTRTPKHLKMLRPTDDSGQTVGAIWEAPVLRKYSAWCPDAIDYCALAGVAEHHSNSSTHGGRTNRSREDALGLVI